MKRSLFIIIGVILVIVLIIIWIYVLFIGTPTSVDEQFANFGMDDTTDVNYQEPIATEPNEPLVDFTVDQRLRQLTTRPVAGFIEVPASSSTPAQVLYMEIGTGHIYAITLTTGEEERISATTIPSAQKAEFSGNGQYVMIEAGFGPQKEFIIGTIDTDTNTLSNTQLAEPITSFSGTDDNRFLYAIQTDTSTIGKIYTPSSLTNETLFTLPFRESSIEWGVAVTDSHYIYPKATRQLESFLYRVKNGAITRMPVDGYGMSALGNESYILYSKQEREAYNTYYYETATGQTLLSPLVQIPEKCLMEEGEFPVTICANSQYAFTSLLPDSWYKGEMVSADNLWEYLPEAGTANLLVNVEQESGRTLDIVNLHLGADGVNVYFTNQGDQTLWQYQRLVEEIN